MIDDYDKYIDNFNWLLKRGQFEEVSAIIRSCFWYGFGSGSQDFTPHIPFHVKGYCNPAWTGLTECIHEATYGSWFMYVISGCMCCGPRKGFWKFWKIYRYSFYCVLLCATRIMRIHSSGLFWVHDWLHASMGNTLKGGRDFGWSLLNVHTYLLGFKCSHVASDMCHVHTTAMNANGISRTSFRFPIPWVKHYPVAHIVSLEKKHVKHVGNFQLSSRLFPAGGTWYQVQRNCREPLLIRLCLFEKGRLKIQ